MADIEIENLRKVYGDFVATDDVSIHIRDGEFFTLLGPSGCGKSTLLSMIAGLVQPEGGRLTVGDRVFSDAATRTFVMPERRDCGLVFQSYALWPHMTVADNLRYGLKIKKVPRAEQLTRVSEALELVGLEALAKRYPHELSGGQQQRAALARTIVARPSVLLLDEPLSNLDAKLRMDARIWLKRIHNDTGLTTVYVTHDQEEALSLSTRIAVMDSGRVMQIADPETLYRRPATREIAAFIGSTHFLAGVVTRTDGSSLTIAVDGYPDASSAITIRAAHAHAQATGDRVSVAIRPEQLRVVDATRVERASSALPCDVEAISYLGGRYLYTLRVGGVLIDADSPERIDSDQIAVVVDADELPVFPYANSQGSHE